MNTRGSSAKYQALESSSLKCCIVGNTKSGKTAVAYRLQCQEFRGDYSATSFDNYSGKIQSFVVLDIIILYIKMINVEISQQETYFLFPQFIIEWNTSYICTKYCPSRLRGKQGRLQIIIYIANNKLHECLCVETIQNKMSIQN